LSGVPEVELPLPPVPPTEQELRVKLQEQTAAQQVAEEILSDQERIAMR
jgi:hypothetical protein